MTPPSLAAAMASLQRYHVATPTSPLPPPTRGITWIWAANGIWKLGIDANVAALVRVQRVRPTPGLVQLVPSVRWLPGQGRMPGSLLAPLLAHARSAGVEADAGRSIVRPIEQQYHLCRMGSRIVVWVPPQAATAGSVRYAMPHAPVLVDIHSHHTMPAYFSATDDRDDLGLSVSCVVGRIFEEPEIVCRLNVWGERQCVPACTVFDTIGSLRDRYGERHAAAHA